MAPLAAAPLLAATFAAALASQCEYPRLEIMEGGANSTLYVIPAGKTAAHISVKGGVLVMDNGPRAYLGSSCSGTDANVSSGDFRLFNFSQPRTITYTVDLSAVGCGCNAALYLVAMPYHDRSTCGDYYCDANFKGCSCPEMDIQEANTHAWQSTPHTCQGRKGNYHTCNKGGCGKQFRGDEYGPGKAIDTKKPFQVSVTLAPDLSEVNLKQGNSKAKIKDECSVNKEALDDGTVRASCHYFLQLSSPNTLPDRPSTCNFRLLQHSNASAARCCVHSLNV